MGRGNFGTVAEEFKDSPVREEKGFHNPNLPMHKCMHAGMQATKLRIPHTPGRRQSAWTNKEKHSILKPLTTECCL